MKTKTVSKILEGKFNKFVKSIEDENVRNLVDANSLITGGAIASLLLNEEVNDFDVYFTNKETTEAVASYFVSKFNTTDVGKVTPAQVDISETDRIKIRIESRGVAGTQEQDAGEELPKHQKTGIKSEKTGDFTPIFVTSNAITLSDDIQLIFRFYGNPTEIHEYYDFVHCTNYWSSQDKELHLNAQALTSLLTKELTYIGSKYPICSILRLRKFINRGFTINAGQILKICLGISELNLLDVKVLADQLVGVDYFYFSQVIAAIEDKQENGAIDKTYLFQVINDIFE